MVQQQICNSCSQEHQCRAVYEKLGKAAGPSVVPKVLVAFLLPIVTFIAALTAFEKILVNLIDSNKLQTACSFLLALLAVLLLILAIKAVNIRFGKGK